MTFPEIQDIVTNNDKQRFSLVPASLDNSSQSLDTADDPSHFIIRANQGHSLAISSEDLLKPVLPTDPDCPQQVVHGTDMAAWMGILKSGGLKKMGRQHMHFATGIPDYHKKAALPKCVPEAAASQSSKEAGDSATDDIEVVGEDGTKNSALKANVDSDPVISGMRKSATIMIWVDLKRSAEKAGLKWWKSDNGVILTEGDIDGMLILKWVTRVEKRGTGDILWQQEKVGQGRQMDGLTLD